MFEGTGFFKKNIMFGMMSGAVFRFKIKVMF
jgi:TfoX/Sxy family transcriptional regulator of competence genes